jgi:hypothetical protein
MRRVSGRDQDMAEFFILFEVNAVS